MKRKTLTLVLCLLTVMSLVGVGFASWVISADTSAVNTGDIIVDTVTDQRYNLSVTVVGANNIIFAAPESATTGWLTSNGEKGTAKLEVIYNCEITAKDSKYKFTSPDTTLINDLYVSVLFEATVDSEVKDASNEAYNTALTNKIFKPLNDGKGYKISAVSMDDDKVTFTLTVGYEWGEIFDYIPAGEGNTKKTNVNPFEFYNTKQANASCYSEGDTKIDNVTSWADHAYYYLNLLSKIENYMNYSVTVTVSKKGENGSQLSISK